jgi:hypothetical protein
VRLNFAQSGWKRQSFDFVIDPCVDLMEIVGGVNTVQKFI